MLKRPFSQRLAHRQNLSSFGPAVARNAVGGSGAAWAGGLIWLAAGLCAGYWALQAGGQGPWVPLQGLAPSAPQADVGSVGRALGALPDAVIADAAPQPAAPLRLLGVVSQSRGGGAALLASGDQPPRPWRVGDEVAEGLVLQSVDEHGAKLGESRWGPTTLALEMPEPKETAPRSATQATAARNLSSNRPLPAGLPARQPVGSPPESPPPELISPR